MNHKDTQRTYHDVSKALITLKAESKGFAAQFNLVTLNAHLGLRRKCPCH